MKFKIVIEQPAEDDLRALFSYICETLKEPLIAKRVYKNIKEQILTLSSFTQRSAAVTVQLRPAKNIRSFIVENYRVFYIIEQKKTEVHILRVLYNHRDWQQLL